LLGVPTLAGGLCQKGCGFRAAPGADRWGRPYDTCCRACAAGAGHDATCLQIAATTGGGNADADLALAMQVEEMRAQAMYQEQEQVLRTLWQQQQNLENRENQLWDPLWGEVNLAPGAAQRFSQHMCFACCPCAMVGCKGSAHRVWRNFLVSWSFLTAALQVAALVGAIVLYGGLMPLTSNPMLGPHYHVFDGIGAKNAARILEYHEWWRLFSPMMLHAGWLHLIGNLAVQLRTGAMLEAVWGHTAWLFIYVTSGAFGVLASCVMTPNHLGVGSSGALCGLLGAWGSFILITWNQTSPVDIKLRNAQTFSVAMSVALIVGLSFLPLMDFAAHVGGLVIGAALSMAIFANRLQHPMWRRGTLVTGIASLIVVICGTLSWFLSQTTPDKALLSLCVPPNC